MWKETFDLKSLRSLSRFAWVISYQLKKKKKKEYCGHECFWNHAQSILEGKYDLNSKKCIMTFCMRFHLFPEFTCNKLILKAQTLCFNRYGSDREQTAVPRCHPCCWRMSVWKCPALARATSPICLATITQAFARCQTPIWDRKKRHLLSAPIQINSKTRSPYISGPTCSKFGHRLTCFWAVVNLRQTESPGQGAHN